VELKLELVVVPVTDVDRAKAFYSDRCGFVVDVDQSFGDAFRVVQLTPPGSACSISIGKGLGDSEPGSMQGLQLCVSDIDATRAELVARGLELTPVRHIDNGEWLDGPGGPWNSFMFFKDPDGNGWAIQEKPR
jgi:catechol 2,3-dioxygenase-like lactoylglutathione lyase family enzyme